MNFLKKRYKTIIGVILLVVAIVLLSVRQTYEVKLDTALWRVKSVDTMKYSRDLSREKLSDLNFDKVIDTQIANIAATGANYVAIATPYDEEFYPILSRWVRAARRHNLHVWFRGNMSGWEGWFNYPKIDRTTHTEMVKSFIIRHSELFQDGDIFSSCPECENGGSGDPRKNGDVVSYRKFLIDEYEVTHKAFSQIHKSVASNYDSMNHDVASLVMDKATTKALGGIVVIDHYIKDAAEYLSDVNNLAKQSGGKIVIGEFGAPIPDLNGKMTDQEQSQWLFQILKDLASTDEVVGVNYWTSMGSSTELWNSRDGSEKLAVSALKEFYTYKPAYGIVEDEIGEPLSHVAIKLNGAIVTHSQDDGVFVLPYLVKPTSFEFSVNGYSAKPQEFANEGGPYTVTLEKNNPSFMYRLKKIFH